jgi:hypothetical protein
LMKIKAAWAIVTPFSHPKLKPNVVGVRDLPKFSPLRQRTIHPRVHSKRVDKSSPTPEPVRPRFSLSGHMALMRIDGRLARLGPWRNVLELVG